MLSSLFIAAANHLLEDARWARERLLPHAGGHAQLSVGRQTFDFSIDEAGYLCECASANEAQVSIRVPLPAAAELAEGVEGLTRRARINGEVEMADALGFVFRHLRWDIEGDLAKALGDVAAHRLHQGATRLLAGQRQALDSVAENLREFAADGHSPALSKTQWGPRSAALRDLRDAVARLDKRLSLVERASPPRARTAAAGESGSPGH